MMNGKFKVLVVDDDVDIRYAIANILRKCDCEVTEMGTVENAFVELVTNNYDVVFSDMRFHGGLGGEDLLAHAKEKYPNLDVVLVSCSMSSTQKKELLANGAAWCLEKPFFKDTCLTVLGHLGYDVEKVA